MCQKMNPTIKIKSLSSLFLFKAGLILLGIALSTTSRAAQGGTYNFNGQQIPEHQILNRLSYFGPSEIPSGTEKLAYNLQRFSPQDQQKILKLARASHLESFEWSPKMEKDPTLTKFPSIEMVNQKEKELREALDKYDLQIDLPNLEDLYPDQFSQLQKIDDLRSRDFSDLILDHGLLNDLGTSEQADRLMSLTMSKWISESNYGLINQLPQKLNNQTNQEVLRMSLEKMIDQNPDDFSQAAQQLLLGQFRSTTEQSLCNVVRAAEVRGLSQITPADFNALPKGSTAEGGSSNCSSEKCEFSSQYFLLESIANQNTRFNRILDANLSDVQCDGVNIEQLIHEKSQTPKWLEERLREHEQMAAKEQLKDQVQKASTVSGHQFPHSSQDDASVLNWLDEDMLQNTLMRNLDLTKSRFAEKTFFIYDRSSRKTWFAFIKRTTNVASSNIKNGLDRRFVSALYEFEKRIRTGNSLGTQKSSSKKSGHQYLLDIIGEHEQLIGFCPISSMEVISLDPTLKKRQRTPEAKWTFEGDNQIFSQIKKLDHFGNLNSSMESFSFRKAPNFLGLIPGHMSTSMDLCP